MPHRPVNLKTTALSPAHSEPCILTPEIIESLCSSLTAGSGIYDACHSLGITYADLSRAMLTDSSVAERIETARQIAIDKVETALFKAALAGNVTAQQVYLYNRRARVWRDMRNSPMVIGRADIKLLNIVRVRASSDDNDAASINLQSNRLDDGD